MAAPEAPNVAAVSPADETSDDASTVVAVSNNPSRGRTWKWRSKSGRGRGGRQATNQDGGAPATSDGNKPRFWLCPQHYQHGKGAQSCIQPCAWQGN